VGLSPNYPNHVWSRGFLFDTTADGRRLKRMPVIDEHTRECLAFEVGRSIALTDVIDVLGRLIGKRGAPAFIRSDDGPEFVADAVRRHASSKRSASSAAGIVSPSLKPMSSDVGAGNVGSEK
jgi:transposase InsO family protein